MFLNIFDCHSTLWNTWLKFQAWKDLVTWAYPLCISSFESRYTSLRQKSSTSPTLHHCIWTMFASTTVCSTLLVLFSQNLYTSVYWYRWFSNIPGDVASGAAPDCSNGEKQGYIRKKKSNCLRRAQTRSRISGWFEKNSAWVQFLLLPNKNAGHLLSVLVYLKFASSSAFLLSGYCIHLVCLD